MRKRITANSHTLEEVVQWLKREYGAVEVSQQSHNYLEQRKCLKASLVMRHRPDLLGELMDLESPEGEDVEVLKAFWEQIQEREKITEYAREDAEQGVYMGNKFLALRKSEVAKAAPDRTALMGKVSQEREKIHIGKKIFGLIFFVIVLSSVAYLSGCQNFNTTFIHVFIIFLVVNIYDLVVLGLIVALLSGCIIHFCFVQ